MLIAYLNMRTEILHLVKLVQSFFYFNKTRFTKFQSGREGCIRRTTWVLQLLKIANLIWHC